MKSNDAGETPDARADQVRSALADHEGPLLRYAHRITGDLERARDVVQETLLRLWSTDAPPQERKLAQWLFAVCRNRAIDIRRKESRMAPLDESQCAAAAKAEAAPPAVAERRETQDRVLQLVELLSEPQREVVCLKFQNGFSYRQIAEITGRSISNVGVLIHEAIGKLRRKLNSGPASTVRA